jgi:hypothetical protein
MLILVRERGVVRGAEVLNRFASCSPDEIINAVRELVANDLVTVKGDVYEADALADSYLTFRPSASAMADFAIRSSIS